MLHINEIDSRELVALLEQEAGREVQLIDVRSPAEVAQGGIRGSENMPLHLLPIKAADISKDRPAVFICRSGARSAQACAFLAARGYEQVINLRGGVIAWARDGLPLEQISMSMASNS